jgi:hypothetical protein
VTAGGWLIWPVAEVPLRCAVLSIQANEDMYQEVKEGVCLEFLPNEATGAVRVRVPQVPLEEDPTGVAL